MATPFGPYSTLTHKRPEVPSYVPPSERERVASYIKYDQMYWNDPRQYALRVLEGEDPLYIPNAQVVVNTTAHYLLKGLSISSSDKNTQAALDSFLTREKFYSRFHSSKTAGVARGDYVFHITGNPNKPEGSRLSLTSVHPGDVFPIWSDDVPDKMIGVNLVGWAPNPQNSDDPDVVRVLTYKLEEKENTRKVYRFQRLYDPNNDWWDPNSKPLTVELSRAALDPSITALPVYWFKNREWDGWDYGVSDLKGVERVLESVSQVETDVQGALSLEGLGVYATDGGRPVDEAGNETDWEISPGRVMEVPAGSYFRRVDGIKSITPATAHVEGLEEKVLAYNGLSDVALGKVEASVAQSGIALKIRFLPTQAKIEQRDLNGLATLRQMFYDWATWYQIFEKGTVAQDSIEVEIGAKLPEDRLEKINELNNLLDRRIISKKYYRSEMVKLGYEFPEDIDKEINEELVESAQIAHQVAMANKSAESSDDDDSEEGSTLPSAGNKSNNKDRPNESSGTEAK